MLRVRLFAGAEGDDVVRSIRLDDSGSSGNCATETPKVRVRNGYLRLIYSNHFEEVGSFDCWYRSLYVRYRNPS